MQKKKNAEKVEEVKVEEVKTEESKAEEVVETTVEETVVKETEVEETHAEETPAEETPAEEAPVEEASVKEPSVEEKETASHKAKRYLRVVAIFVAFFVGGSLIGSLISDVFFFDKTQQQLLREEIAKIGVLTNEETYDMAALTALLEETVTSDEYIPLEKAMKAFTKDVIDVTITVETAMNNSIISTALTANNISADGPDFTNTLAELNALYTTFETAKVNFQNLMTEEKVLSYLPKDTDEELVTVYTEITSGIRMTPTDQRYISMIESLDKMMEIIDAERAAINYLVENQEDWNLKDGYIYFDTLEQTEEYNDLISEFTKLTAE